MKRKNHRRSENAIVHHHGIFHRRLSLWEAVALIISGTIGAGVLGVPYAVAKVGLGIGLLYIVIIGLLMMGLNLLVGEIAVRSKQQLQLVGFAKKYLGNSGKLVMSLLMYSLIAGVLVVYIIGSGEALAALFGGSSVHWGIVFFVLMALMIYVGIRTVKTVETILSFGILFVVLCIAAISVGHIDPANLTNINLAYAFLPYGVMLFAYHGVTTVPEAHSILKKKDGVFKKAIIISGLISIVVYALFALVIVGVTGEQTTEIATIGLGQQIGPAVFMLGNIFALLAMGTSFLVNGLAVKDSLVWDYKIGKGVSTLLVCGIPFVVFLLGLRQFIAAIDIVGGVFMSIEMLLLLLIYWKAKQRRDWMPGRYRLHHTTFLAMLLVIAFAVGAVYSVLNLF